MRITNLHTGLFISGSATTFALAGLWDSALFMSSAALIAFTCHYFQVVRKERHKIKESAESLMQKIDTGNTQTTKSPKSGKHAQTIWATDDPSLKDRVQTTDKEVETAKRLIRENPFK